jgi:TonB family protein
MLSQVLKSAVFASALVISNYALAGDAPATYGRSVMEAVSSKLEYPKMAKMRHQEGSVQLAIAVDGSGKPSSTTVEKSSGIQSLDDAAVAAVNAAAPFAAPAEAGAVVHGAVKFVE